MIQELPFFPELPFFSYEITLDGQQYTIGYTYRDQRQSWYVSITAIDGAPLLQGQRLTPGANITSRILTGGPPGILTALGADPYARDEVRVYYIPAEDAAALVSVPTDYRVAIK